MCEGAIEQRDIVIADYHLDSKNAGPELLLRLRGRSKSLVGQVEDRLFVNAGEGAPKPQDPESRYQCDALRRVARCWNTAVATACNQMQRPAMRCTRIVRYAAEVLSVMLTRHNRKLLIDVYMDGVSHRQR